MIAFFVFVTIMDLCAAGIIFAGALSERMRLYPAWHKVGLIVAVIGLTAQAMRNIQFLYTGVSPSDTDMPLWALKDAGISIIAFYYFYLAMCRYFDNQIQQTSKPPQKKQRTKKQLKGK
jgi:hypothetical protein